MHLGGVLCPHVHGKVDQTVGVSPFVVVPAHDLNEGVIQRDASLHVKDTGTRVADEVHGDVLVARDAQDASHGASGGTLGSGDDLFKLGRFFQLARQVHNRHVVGGNAERHSGELAVQLGNDDTNCLRGTRGSGDNVAAGSATGAPVLATTAGAVVGQLVGGHGVHGCHQPLLDAEVVVDDLGDGSQAVGGAGSVGHDLHALVVAGVVHAQDEGGSLVVLGRGRNNDLGGGGVSFQVSRRGGGGAEHASGLADHPHAGVLPGNVARVALREDGDGAAVDHELPVLGLDSAIEAAVDRVVLEQVRHVLEVHERIIDGNNLNAGVRGGGAAHEAPDAAEAVDSDLDSAFVGHD